MHGWNDAVPFGKLVLPRNGIFRKFLNKRIVAIADADHRVRDYGLPDGRGWRARRQIRRGRGRIEPRWRPLDRLPSRPSPLVTAVADGMLDAFRRFQEEGERKENVMQTRWRDPRCWFRRDAGPALAAANGADRLALTIEQNLPASSFVSTAACRPGRTWGARPPAPAARQGGAGPCGAARARERYQTLQANLADALARAESGEAAAQVPGAPRASSRAWRRSRHCSARPRRRCRRRSQEALGYLEQSEAQIAALEAAIEARSGRPRAAAGGQGEGRGTQGPAGRQTRHSQALTRRSGRTPCRFGGYQS